MLYLVSIELRDLRSQWLHGSLCNRQRVVSYGDVLLNRLLRGVLPDPSPWCRHHVLIEETHPDSEGTVLGIGNEQHSL